ncbi:TylF/MycF/NovP-related O-methyltransferase [Kiloniella majae]|uniref:TylF/MycF/NovP-related O-methyltransferase n=1 Tax=Kiloniella majae TaxID=1938558 RepID=UPI000A277453|nr:TylF/MycF/NovP-related O-methyltransferase [Kiloniella majae]
MPENDYVIPTVGGENQKYSKETLLEFALNPPKKNDELLSNVGLYLRSVMLAKILYLNELYEIILDKPGVIMEFGVWWGANQALFNNLRAIYEPYNRMRKVIGFDTFEGYPTVTDEDGSDKSVAVGGYKMPEGYIDTLSEILRIHEIDNPLEHIKKFELIQGNAPESLEKYFHDKPETSVALAYLDMAMYEPTKEVLKILEPHMIRGGVIALDEFGSSKFPGETKAFKEVFGLNKFKMRKSKFLPDRTIVILE